MPRATTGSIHPPAGAVEVRPLLCPYCGGAAVGGQCASCGGLLEPLSMQATQNEMGPWFIRDTAHPFRPGCAYSTLCRLAARGRITPETVLRGPTTRQFWSFARNVRGVAHLLGSCHNCHGPASADEYMCRNCGAVFEAPTDRQHFGAGAVRLIPGHAPAEIVARSVAPPEGESAPSAAPSPQRAPKRSTSRRAAEMVPASTARALKRRLAQMRRFVTVSVAVNVVLLVMLLISALSSKLTLNEGPTNAAPAPVVVDQTPSPAVADEALAQLATARELAASDDADDWRTAETILRSTLSGIPEADRPQEATALLEEIQHKLSDRSLEEFLPQD